MKFVRVFALLIAVVMVLSGVQDLLNLIVVDSGVSESTATGLAFVQVAIGALFGAAAYWLTTNEDD